MVYYKKLRELVLKNELEILYIISPPRTLSTILEISLAEYGHGQIHEPFHKRRRLNFDDSCGIIYRRFIALKKNNQEEIIKLVIKDLSKFIKPKEWEMLVKLTKNFVFTIREPSKQIFSMASRYANDLEDYDSDNLSYDQILKNLSRIPFEDLAFGYWENLLELFEITKRHISLSGGLKHLVVMSGITFRFDPLDSLIKLVDHLKLNVEPKKLLKNWTVGSGSNFYRPEYILNRQPNDKFYFKGAWLGPAINSNSFRKLNPKFDEPQDIDIYDTHLQEYFTKSILPVYVKMYLSNQNICKPKLEIVSTKAFQKSLLVMSNPIEAYLLYNSYPEVTIQQKALLEKNSKYIRNNIIKNYPFISMALFALVKKQNESF